jgi:hypothetical protein
MATIVVPNFLTQKTYNGLNSYQYTVASAAMHTCRVEVDHREASTMTISIVQAGSVNSTLATMTLPGGTSTAGGPEATAILQALANCAIGDTLTFVLSSSAVIDEQLNTVKARLNVHVGGLN